MSLAGKVAPGERSPFVGLRLTASEVGEVDALAEIEGVNRSEMIRRLIQAGRNAYGGRK